MTFLDSIPEVLFLAAWLLIALALSIPPLLRARRARRAARDLTLLGHPRIGIDRRSSHR